MLAKRTMLALLMAATITTIARAQQTDAEYRANAKKYDPIGVWLVDVMPQGEGAPPPFKALATFHADGTIVETESDTLIPPFITPGHGLWEKTRNNEFAFFIQFLTFDESGNFTGTARAQGTVIMNEGPDKYTSPATVEFFDADGTFLFGGDASGVGRRLKLVQNSSADPVSSEAMSRGWGGRGTKPQ